MNASSHSTISLGNNTLGCGATNNGLNELYSFQTNNSSCTNLQPSFSFQNTGVQQQNLKHLDSFRNVANANNYNPQQNANTQGLDGFLKENILNNKRQQHMQLPRQAQNPIHNLRLPPSTTSEANPLHYPISPNLFHNPLNSGLNSSKHAQGSPITMLNNTASFNVMQSK